jgi:hypothetical protein
MASLTDLFSPSFFMFLGIMVLIVALLVVYFESKMRDQNHKIASMLSLVSTLAEDMNGVKIALHHLSLEGGSHLNQTFGNHLAEIHSNDSFKNDDKKLIVVSDDEYESDDESVVDESVVSDDESVVSDDESLDDESDSDSEKDDLIKVLKISNEKDDDEADDLDDIDVDDLDDIDDIDVDDLDDLSIESGQMPSEASSNDELVEELKSFKFDISIPDETNETTSSESKTISINLEENLDDSSIDYKKLPLPKLRSIVSEKGLAKTADASKMKKQELLKLLGSE